MSSPDLRLGEKAIQPVDGCSAEARELAINGIMGRCWREFLLPIYLGLGLGRFLKHDPSMPDEEVDQRRHHVDLRFRRPSGYRHRCRRGRTFTP